MISVTAILLIRLVPYAIAAILAARKGYRWLVVFALYLMGAATYFAAFDPDTTIRGIVSSFGAIFLLLHALNLKPRG